MGSHERGGRCRGSVSGSRSIPPGNWPRSRGKLEPLQVIPETIRIRGRNDVHLDVRISRHGPLVSDAINANNLASPIPARQALAPLEPLAFRWTALDADDSTLAAMLKISEAHSWSDFTEALREFVVPSQNFVYADTAGHIGYYAPGRIPIRSSGDGSLPSAGWTGESEWTGWIPFEDLPHTFDPPGHVIVTANQRPMPASYPYLLGLDWPESYRARRIANLLVDRPKLNPDDFAAIQRDTLSLHAQTILPLLLSLARPDGAAATDAIRMLRRWNYDARPESAAAAIYEAWFLHLAPMLLGNRLGRLTTDSYQGRFSVCHSLPSADVDGVDRCRIESGRQIGDLADRLADPGAPTPARHNRRRAKGRYRERSI